MRISKKSAVFLAVALLVTTIALGSRWFRRAGAANRLDGQAENSGEYDNAVFGRFADELAEADELDDDLRDEAVEILDEADSVWSRVKQQNRQAIKRANNPPRILRPIRSQTPVSGKDEVPPTDAN